MNIDLSALNFSINGFECKYISHVYKDNKLVAEFDLNGVTDTVSLDLNGFFRKRKKKGFVYVGRLNTPIFKTKKGVVYVDGKKEWSWPISRRGRSWLKFNYGDDSEKTFLKHLDEWNEFELNPFDFVYEDIFDSFLVELNRRIYNIKSLWIRYIVKNKKLHKALLQNQAKKLFNGIFSEYSPVYTPDNVNFIDKIDQGSRIFFVDRKGRRMRVNSKNFFGIFDMIGTAEGALINSKNRLCLGVQVSGGSLSFDTDKGRVDMYDLYDKGIKYGDYGSGEYTLKNIFSFGASFIPMLNFCDTTRAILSVHMLGQAVPLVYGEPPIIDTGFKFDLQSIRDGIYETNYNTVNIVKNGIPDTFTQDLKTRISYPLFTAYMNWYGYDQEDAIVLSESAAKKLSIWRVYQDDKLEGDIIDASIWSNFAPEGDFRKYWCGRGNKVVVKKKKVYPVQIGDKITTRYGSKGVVSLIVPDSDMPITECGIRVEAIQNPMTVPARKNVAQYYEAILTRNMYGKGDLHPCGVGRMIIPCFAEKPKIGEYGDYLIINGNRTKHKILTGWNEFYRLRFFAEDKDYFLINGEGNKRNFRIDEMGVWALMAHNSIDVIASESDVAERNIWLKSELLKAGYIYE